jgi:sulfite exporter TauE/SafE
MLAFGLGTVPMLAALTFFSAKVASSLRDRLFRLAGVIVVMGGALLVLRGLADLRLLPHGPVW